jgi:uncharacterized protein (DUF4415 family)
MLANVAFACCVLSHAPSRWPDWKRVDTLTDEDITQAIAEDPDTFEPEPEWPQRAMILRPGQPKIRVTAYFDQEVVEWFRAQGRGYQTRMNAVLHAYIVRDPNDDMILACAVATSASHVVTRDDDLLSLGTYEGIAIVTPEAFLTAPRHAE